MLSHHLLVGSDVNTVNLVLSNVAVQPLDLRTLAVQDAAGLLRDGDNLVRGYPAYVRDVALDDVLGHAFLFAVGGVQVLLAAVCRGEILGDEAENSHCCMVAVYWGK